MRETKSVGSLGAAAVMSIDRPSAIALTSTVRAEVRARCAAVSAPITVPTPSTAMSEPASSAPPWNVSSASRVVNVGKFHTIVPTTPRITSVPRISTRAQT